MILNPTKDLQKKNRGRGQEGAQVEGEEAGMGVACREGLTSPESKNSGGGFAGSDEQSCSLEARKGGEGEGNGRRGLRASYRCKDGRGSGF